MRTNLTLELQHQHQQIMIERMQVLQTQHDQELAVLLMDLKQNNHSVTGCSSLTNQKTILSRNIRIKDMEPIEFESSGQNLTLFNASSLLPPSKPVPKQVCLSYTSQLEDYLSNVHHHLG